MAANFWLSSHCQTWLLPSEEQEQDRSPRVRERKSRTNLDAEEVKKLRVNLAMFISNLGKHAQIKTRQRVIATATVYAARFYYYYAYRDHHPHLIGATALHLASKVEEHHIALRNIEKAANELVKFQYKVSDIVDAEYILMDSLKNKPDEGSGASLLVFHPYRPMEQYVEDAGLAKEILATCWHLINDSYRIDLCLHHPPHIIAIAVILIAGSYHGKDMPHAVNEWYRGLQFKEEHRHAIKVVQEALLTMYDELSHMEHDEVMELLEKLSPNQNSGGAMPAACSPEGYRTAPPGAHSVY